MNMIDKIIIVDMVAMPEIESETHDYDSCAMPLSPHCQNTTAHLVYITLATSPFISNKIFLGYLFILFDLVILYVHLILK